MELKYLYLNGKALMQIFKIFSYKILCCFNFNINFSGIEIKQERMRYPMIFLYNF